MLLCTKNIANLSKKRLPAVILQGLPAAKVKVILFCYG